MPTPYGQSLLHFSNRFGEFREAIGENYPTQAANELEVAFRVAAVWEAAIPVMIPPGGFDGCAPSLKTAFRGADAFVRRLIEDWGWPSPAEIDLPALKAEAERRLTGMALAEENAGRAGAHAGASRGDAERLYLESGGSAADPDDEVFIPLHLTIREPRYKLAEEADAEFYQLRSAPLVGPVAAKIPDGDRARELAALAERLERLRPGIVREIAAEKPGKLESEPDWIYGSEARLGPLVGYGGKTILYAAKS